MTKQNYEILLEFATDRQAEIIRAIIECGSQRKAAKHLGCARTNVDRAVMRAKRTAARQGVSPEDDMTHPSPEGFVVKGVSSYYGQDGELRGQWVKTTQDTDKANALLEAAQVLADELEGKAKPVSKPERCVKSHLTVYPMGDPHLGLYAWHEETGDDFDADIAEKNLCAAVDRLVACAPATEQALIINLGDFFHTDNMEYKTKRSGHVQDVDGRWARVLRIGVRVMQRSIDAALKKHKKVRVINEIGNHDDQTSIMLSLVLDAYYRKEKRVDIDMSPSWFHYYKFGQCLIGVTHGDKVKPGNLPGIMAHDKAKEWGSTKHRYWYIGHVHHDTLKEFPGCKVESFRTLAAKDAWHTAQGYRSGRDMQCIVLNKDYGEVERHRVGVEML